MEWVYERTVSRMSAEQLRRELSSLEGLQSGKHRSECNGKIQLIMDNLRAKDMGPTYH